MAIPLDGSFQRDVGDREWYDDVNIYIACWSVGTVDLPVKFQRMIVLSSDASIAHVQGEFRVQPAWVN